MDPFNVNLLNRPEIIPEAAVFEFKIISLLFRQNTGILKKGQVTVMIPMPMGDEYVIDALRKNPFRRKADPSFS
jgi:hypothetical protein